MAGNKKSHSILHLTKFTKSLLSSDSAEASRVLTISNALLALRVLCTASVLERFRRIDPREKSNSRVPLP